MPPEIGLVAPASAEETRQLEDLAVDSLWVGGHLASPRVAPEPMVWLARLAEQTQRVAVGTATLVLTVLPPVPVISSTLSVTVANGAPLNYQITATNNPTSFGATGLPSGVTASFSTNPVTPPANGSATSVLTLTASSTATVGTATVTITGTSGSTTHSTTISLTVNSSSATKNFTLALNPSSFTIDQRRSVSTTLTITSVNGFSGSVDLSVNEFPSGVSATASHLHRYRSQQ